MAVFSSIISALGTAVGAASSALGSTSLIGAAGLGISGAGVLTNYLGQQKAMEGQRKAEELRAKQMEFEGMRRTREVFRQQQAARSMALASATSGGSAEGSILQGAYGGIEGRTGTNLTGIQGNLGFGRGMFAANAERDAGQSMAATGGAMTSLGGSVINNAGLINRVGTYFLSDKTVSYT